MRNKMKRERTTAVTLRIPQHLYSAIREAAEITGWSMQNVMNHLMEPGNLEVRDSADGQAQARALLADWRTAARVRIATKKGAALVAQARRGESPTP